MARRGRSNLRPGKGRTLQTIKNAAIAVDQFKQRLEPGLDKVLAITAANVGTVYAASVLIDRSNLSNPSDAFIMMTTGAALTAGNYLALRNKDTNPFRKMVSKVNEGLDGFWPTSWAKTIALATIIGISCNSLYPYVEQMVDDFIPVTERLPLPEQSGKSLERIVQRNRPAIYNVLGHEHRVNHDFSYATNGLANPGSMTGRIQRTLRWQPIYRAVERAYGLPEDLLAGMIMQESMGNPVLPNAGGDGGLGIVHFQCATANEWGLKTYGTCKGIVDRAHGADVKILIDELKPDPTLLQKYDERALIVKVLDAAGRYLSHYS
ncbi:lysozyme family protein, partial [Candidatus Woesearchaeota archaeon]|nr:lysozyme family protein [Candidatus Woesearchaeota archaeon]